MDSAMQTTLAYRALHVTRWKGGLSNSIHTILVQEAALLAVFGYICSWVRFVVTVKEKPMRLASWWVRFVECLLCRRVSKLRIYGSSRYSTYVYVVWPVGARRSVLLYTSTYSEYRYVARLTLA